MIPLGGAARDVIAKLPHPKGAVFVVGTRSADPAVPLDQALVQRQWRLARAAAGLPTARIHDLRHTAGTVAAIRGANAFAIRDLLGHAGVGMTSRYVERVQSLGLADQVASHVAAAMAGKPTDTKPKRQRARAGKAG